jgi:hypothetical protein
MKTLTHRVETKPGTTIPQLKKWCGDPERPGDYTYQANVTTKGFDLLFSDPAAAEAARVHWG